MPRPATAPDTLTQVQLLEANFDESKPDCMKRIFDNCRLRISLATSTRARHRCSALVVATTVSVLRDGDSWKEPKACDPVGDRRLFLAISERHLSYLGIGTVQ